MKTKMILLTAGMILAGLVYVQAQTEDRFSIGPRVGVNFSNVSNTDGSKSLTGLALGLTSTYSLDESTGITLDVLYSSEGYKLSGIDYSLRYIQVPIYFDLFFGKLGERFRPKVYVGVVPGFYLGNKRDGVDQSDDTFNKFQLAASGGLGFNYRVAGRIWLNTDVRSYIGLSDIFHKDFAGDDPISPRTVQVSLGLAYGLAKL